MNESATPLGLIAGQGRLPLLIAEGAKAAGRTLAVLGFRGLADPGLADLADEFAWGSVTRPGRWIRFFHRCGATQAIFAGGVRKADMHTRWRLLHYLPDLRAIHLWYFRLRHDKRDNAVLNAMADELATEGIEVMSTVEYCPDHLASDGPMTRAGAPRNCQADIEFGFEIARRSADLDIGQSIAVKERDIIAVEAVEGTDAMIARAGKLCPAGGWTMIKVARPNQDMRFDVPAIGMHTIENLRAAGAACLVLEADKTLIIDKPETLALADKCGIAVVGKRP